MPIAAWWFTGIEAAPLCSEEVVNAKVAVPKAMKTGHRREGEGREAARRVLSRSMRLSHASILVALSLFPPSVSVQR
jgi:amino acid transporter